MNNLVKIAALTALVGAALVPSTGEAAVVQRQSIANAPARCQAFTPGVSNTIRNRVIGSENVGTNPLAVACAFEKPSGTGISNITGVQAYFSTNTGSSLTVTCTMLTGWQGMAGAVAVTKSTLVTTATSNAQITFTAADTPSTTDTDLGTSNEVGINCTLPFGAVLNDTYLRYSEEDGV